MAGLEGLLVPLLIFLAVWWNQYRLRKKIPTYNFDPGGRPGAFEPLLQKYLHLAEFMIGLATGSIVLLIGSSVLHGKDGRLPSFYAPPLFILATSVITAIGFMVFLVYKYEDVQHGNPHTAWDYALIEALGFSSLLFFLIGYLWLIFVVTR